MAWTETEELKKTFSVDFSSHHVPSIIAAPEHLPLNLSVKLDMIGEGEKIQVPLYCIFKTAEVFDMDAWTRVSSQTGGWREQSFLEAA